MKYFGKRVSTMQRTNIVSQRSSCVFAGFNNVNSRLFRTIQSEYPRYLSSNTVCCSLSSSSSTQSIFKQINQVDDLSEDRAGRVIVCERSSSAHSHCSCRVDIQTV